MRRTGCLWSSGRLFLSLISLLPPILPFLLGLLFRDILIGVIIIDVWCEGKPEIIDTLNGRFKLLVLQVLLLLPLHLLQLSLFIDKSTPLIDILLTPPQPHISTELIINFGTLEAITYITLRNTNHLLLTKTWIIIQWQNNKPFI